MKERKVVGLVEDLDTRPHVGAGYALAVTKDATPDRAFAGFLLAGVEAAQAGEAHDEEGEDDHPRGDAGPSPCVDKALPPHDEARGLLGVGQDASEEGRLRRLRCPSFSPATAPGRRAGRRSPGPARSTGERRLRERGGCRSAPCVLRSARIGRGQGGVRPARTGSRACRRPGGDRPGGRAGCRPGGRSGRCGNADGVPRERKPERSHPQPEPLKAPRSVLLRNRWRAAPRPRRPRRARTRPAR